MPMKPLNPEEVRRVANAIIREKGETTTLDVKNKLRSEGFFAEQKAVAQLMRDLAIGENWATRSAGNHLIYFLVEKNGPASSFVGFDRPTIVLLTVNDHETHAVLDAFLGLNAVLVQEPRGGVTYNVLGRHGEYNVVHGICEMGAGGLGASQQRTRDAIEHWKPTAVIAVGIAFGVDEAKQRIGDVLVATQVVNYDLGRINADGTLTARADRPSCSDILVNRFRQTDTLGARSNPRWPKVRFGPLLSGQKLVDNVDYRASLKGLASEAIGGEMEATWRLRPIGSW
jgi:nucleoside phosphorylase